MIRKRMPERWGRGLRKTANGLMWGGAILATLIALLPLVLVLYYVVWHGLPALNWAFFTHMPMPPGEPGGGMANAIIGTVILVGLASLLGLPIGLLGGVYLAEYGNSRVGAAIRFTADVLVSVPSIVIGILAYSLVVLPMKHCSALAGGFALGIMMIPTVMRTTEEMVRMVPMAQREASLALGVTHFSTIFRVVIVAARGGIITGILLAIARVAGETAPLLFTTLGNNFWSTDLGQPIASLPLQIFKYATAPDDNWNAQAWAGALVLVLLILVLSLASRYATKSRFRIVR